MKHKPLALMLLAAVLTTCSWSGAVEPPAMPVQIDELVFQDDDFVAETSEGTTLLPDGLGQEPGALESTFTSPAIEAPLPFNAVVAQWIADVQPPASMEIFLRTGNDGDYWEPWQEVHPSADWTLPGDEDVVGEMVVVPAAAGTHSHVQYKITFSRDEDSLEPLLQSLRLTFIDSTAGPTVADMIAAQERLDERAGEQADPALLTEDEYAKPFVISRQVWCTSPDCNYSAGLEYHPVTHLILHHTVSGSGGDSAATVRAIWAYHTYTREWGDIGYNYLVDTNGVLFEGHLGGDDVVGVHAREANAGTMALSMIGDYRTIKPSDPMIASAIELFAWKADQRDIDVFDASATLPNLDRGLPHLMGHRDVYGDTLCPGDAGFALLPLIRDEVAARIGLKPAHIYVDELSAAFTKSNANWYVPQLQCGHNLHAWYTWSTTDPAESANSAEWRPIVPQTGRYQVQAYIPYCNTGEPETLGASYTIEHADGSSRVVINQDANVGLWASLGDYRLTAGTDNVIRLSDLTTTDDGRGLWFDALRLLPLEPQAAARPLAPADGEWLTRRAVTFQWALESPETIAGVTIQVATDAQFSNVVFTNTWTVPATSVTHEFGQDYGALNWRLVLSITGGGSWTSPTATFGIDSESPVSVVAPPLYLPRNGEYLISWSGSDRLHEVSSYTVEFREASNPETSWQIWLSNVPEGSALFRPLDLSATYEFRSQARDALGNLEAAHPTADTSTGEAVVLSHAIMLPIIETP